MFGKKNGKKNAPEKFIKKKIKLKNKQSHLKKNNTPFSKKIPESQLN